MVISTLKIEVGILNQQITIIILLSDYYYVIALLCTAIINLYFVPIIHVRTNTIERRPK